MEPKPMIWIVEYRWKNEGHNSRPGMERFRAVGTDEATAIAAAKEVFAEFYEGRWPGGEWSVTGVPKRATL